MKKKIRMRYLWTYRIVFVHHSFFLVTWNLSTRWKNLLLTCKKWQQHDAICYACFLFLCTCTKNLHIDLDLDLCSAHLDLRSACLLFCARRSSFKNWWRNAREKRFFACFFVLVRKKICIFIWSIRPVHAMLRTCKKWHHVHAMLCTRFCIKKKHRRILHKS